MSADLFAQFGPPSGSSLSSNQQPQTKSSNSQSQTDDTFDFLNASLPQPQKTQTQTQQPWPDFDASLQPSQPTSSWTGGGWSNSIATETTKRRSSAAGNDDDDNDDGDDTWGDFEEASPGAQTQVITQPTAMPPIPSTSHAVSPPAQPPVRTRVVRASTMDLLTNNLISFGDASPAVTALPSLPERSPQPQPRQTWRNPEPQVRPHPQPQPTNHANPNVLFDAEDFDGNETSSDDDDDFGDFESGHSSPLPAAFSHNSSRAIANPARTSTTPAAATALVDLLSLADPESAAVASSPTIVQPSSHSGYSNEQLPSSATHPRAANLLSPLSFGSTSPVSTEAMNPPQPPISPSFQERNPFPGLAVTTPQSTEFPSEKVQNRTPSPVTNWPSFEPSLSTSVTQTKVHQLSEDDWDTWSVVDSGVRQPTAYPQNAQKPKLKAEPVTSDWDWDIEAPKKGSDSPNLPPAIAKIAAPKSIPENAPPPTNVPPPSIILSLFPNLMALPDEALFKPTATQPVEMRNRIIGNPKTIAFLRNYLQIIVVAIYVTAGRKQRWHRDKFLSQSMSISAAGSSKGGGMKLAGIDKAQGQREDREAADVVAVWQRHVGKLRSTVATANAALVAAEAAEHKHYPPLKIPELQSATIPITVAKNVPTAARPCVVCGLRRDERVRGIDGADVQDIFGEWWVEHWGHRACRNFWVEHEATLRSR